MLVKSVKVTGSVHFTVGTLLKGEIITEIDLVGQVAKVKTDDTVIEVYIPAGADIERYDQ